MASVTPSLYTQQTAGSSPQAASLSAGGKTSGVLTGATGTGGFLDLLLATLLTGQSVPGLTDGTATADQTAAAQDGTTTTTEDPALALLQTQVTTAETTDKTTADDATASAVAAALLVPVSATTDPAPISTGESATISEGENAEIDAALNTAPTAGDDLNGQMDARLKAQLAALSPEAGQPKNNDQTPATDGAGVIVPEEQSTAPAVDLTQKTATNTTADTQTTDANGPLPADTEPTSELAAQLNALTVGSGDTEKSTGKSSKATSLIDSLMKNNTDLSVQDGYKSSALTDNSYQNLAQVRATTTQTSTALDPTMSGKTTPTTDDAIMSIDLSGLSPDQWSGLTQAAVQTASNNGVTQASVSTAQNQHAAVNTVTLHLQQMAQNRDTRSLTLQLNPPELGKVQVKMSFGRDKSVKADITIEKSDTFNMLKNDAEALKQALSDAGLTPDSASLNFSLADQGGFADTLGQGNSQTGANDNGGTAEGDDLAVIEIKSSEEWSVDPKTGTVRYNIVV